MSTISALVQLGDDLLVQISSYLDFDGLTTLNHSFGKKGKNQYLCSNNRVHSGYIKSIALELDIDPIGFSSKLNHVNLSIDYCDEENSFLHALCDLERIRSIKELNIRDNRNVTTVSPFLQLFESAFHLKINFGNLIELGLNLPPNSQFAIQSNIIKSVHYCCPNVQVLDISSLLFNLEVCQEFLSEQYSWKHVTKIELFSIIKQFEMGIECTLLLNGTVNTEDTKTWDSYMLEQCDMLEYETLAVCAVVRSLTTTKFPSLKHIEYSAFCEKDILTFCECLIKYWSLTADSVRFRDNITTKNIGYHCSNNIKQQSATFIGNQIQSLFINQAVLCASSAYKLLNEWSELFKYDDRNYSRFSPEVMKQYCLFPSLQLLRCNQWLPSPQFMMLINSVNVQDTTTNNSTLRPFGIDLCPSNVGGDMSLMSFLQNYYESSRWAIQSFNLNKRQFIPGSISARKFYPPVRLLSKQDRCIVQQHIESYQDSNNYCDRCTNDEDMYSPTICSNHNDDDEHNNQHCQSYEQEATFYRTLLTTISDNKFTLLTQFTLPIQIFLYDINVLTYDKNVPTLAIECLFGEHLPCLEKLKIWDIDNVYVHYNVLTELFMKLNKNDACNNSVNVMHTLKRIELETKTKELYPIVKGKIREILNTTVSSVDSADTRVVLMFDTMSCMLNC